MCGTIKCFNVQDVYMCLIVLIIRITVSVSLFDIYIWQIEIKLLKSKSTNNFKRSRN